MCGQSALSNMRLVIVFVVTIITLVAGAVFEKWHRSTDDSLFYIDAENKVRMTNIVPVSIDIVKEL